MQFHRPSISIIVIPSRAKSSLRNYAQAVAISTAYVLKSYFPMTRIIMVVYEALPFPLRMMVKQEAFLKFCLSHCDRLLAEASGSGA